MAKLSFTQEQYEEASRIRLIDFMRQNGHKLKREGADYRLKEYGNLVFRSGERWYSNDEQRGGVGIINFLTDYDGRSLPEAINLLVHANNNYERMDIAPQNHIAAPKGGFVLPPANENNNRVYAYLCKSRCLDRDIVHNLIKQNKLYESKEHFIELFAPYNDNGEMRQKFKAVDDRIFEKLKTAGQIDKSVDVIGGMTLGKYDGKIRCVNIHDLSNLQRMQDTKQIKSFSELHNAVFVGFDEEKTPRLGIQRSTNTNIKFQADVTNSDKAYPFTMDGTSNRLFVFEAPIDAVSLASILKLKGHEWEKDSYLVLDGLSPIGLDGYLKNNPHIKQIGFCLDNDSAAKTVLNDKFDKVTGDLVCKGFTNTYMEQGYSVGVLPPLGKDFNDDLVDMVNKAKEPTEDLEAEA